MARRSPARGGAAIGSARPGHSLPPPAGPRAQQRAASRGPGSARKAAAATGLSITTVTNILRGISWPDIDTVARLEKALDASLWGDEHLTGTGNSD